MNKIDYDHLRAELRVRMEMLGLSQRKLSDPVDGLDHAELSRFLGGQRDTLTLEVIEGMAEVLGCSRSDLTGEPPVTIVRMIPVDRLLDDPFNPRHGDDSPDPELEGLAQSILDLGVLEPLLVRADGIGGYFVTAGRRRRKAILLNIERGEMAEATEVPCSVITADDAEALVIGLVENVHRRDMHPLDEASAFERIQQLASCSEAEVARRVGFEPRYVQQRIMIGRNLSPNAKVAFRQGHLNFTQARLIAPCVGEVQDIVVGRIGAGYYGTTDQLATALRQESLGFEQREQAKRQPSGPLFSPPADKPPATEPNSRAPEVREPEDGGGSGAPPAVDQQVRERERTSHETAQKLAQIKAKELNAGIQAALRRHPDALWRVALFEVFCDFQATDAIMDSPLINAGNYDQEALCRRHLDCAIEEGEDGEDWNQRLWTRVWEIDNPQQVFTAALIDSTEAVGLGWEDGKPTPAVTSPWVAMLARRLEVAPVEALYRGATPVADEEAA